MQMQHMWNVRTKEIPVVTGETGTVSKSFRIHLRNTEGKHNIKELRKQQHWALAKYFVES